MKRQFSTTYTRQGIRNLDPKHNGKRPPVNVCFHEWEADCDGSCNYELSCTCPGERCRKCGERR